MEKEVDSVEARAENQQLLAEIKRLKQALSEKDQLILQREQELKDTQKKLAHYYELWRLLNQNKFAHSSEKGILTDEKQLLLSDFYNIPMLNEAEATLDLAEENDSRKPVQKKERKQHRRQEEWLEPLVSKVIDHRPKVDEPLPLCPCCDGSMHLLKTDEFYEVDLIPARVKVTKHIEPSYACRQCQATGIQTPITRISTRESVLNRSGATAGTLAWLIDQKYNLGLPLYRIESYCKAQLSFPLLRQTISRWLMESAEQYIKPLYDAMHQTLLAQKMIHVDETELQVLREPDKRATSKSYAWTYCTGRGSPPIILYEYCPSRSAKHPTKFLDTYQGAMQTDAFSAYTHFDKRAGCLAHARRPFAELAKLYPSKVGESLTKSEIAVAKLNAIYHEEHRIQELLPPPYTEAAFEQIRLMRKERLLPLFDDFFSWCAAHILLSKDKLKQAIAYCLNHKANFYYILENPRCELDNNRIEREAIKPFVMGRKAWLFSNTPRGADSSMMLYSLVVTARKNNLIVQDYLAYIFKTMSHKKDLDKDTIDSLLPWSPSIPLHLKNKN